MPGPAGRSKASKNAELLVRDFRQSPKSMKERSAQREATGQRNFVMTSKRFQYYVIIPPGHPDVNNIQVRRDQK